MQGGFIRFGKAYGMGVIMYVVVGVVGAIVNFLMFTLDTSLVDTLLEKQEQKMIDDGMTGDQIEMAMSITESMMSPAMMAVTSVFPPQSSNEIIQWIWPKP